MSGQWTVVINRWNKETMKHDIKRDSMFPPLQYEPKDGEYISCVYVYSALKELHIFVKGYKQ